MEIKIKLSRLQNIAFAPKDEKSLIDRLYATRPALGGNTVASAVRELRRQIVKHLGPESYFEERRQQLIDDHHLPAAEGETFRQFKSDADRVAFIVAMDDLINNTEVEIQGQLFEIGAIDSAGFALSGIEQDALDGLLIFTPNA